MAGNNSLQSLYNHLKKFHLSDSLYVIGAVNAALKYGTHKLDQNNENIPNWIKEWLKKRGRSEQDRRSIAIVLSRMARFLLLSSANDHKGIFLDLNLPSAHSAYNMVLNLEDEYLPDEYPADTIGRFVLYFNRIGQIQLPLQASRKRVIGRGFLLFHKLILSTPTDYEFDRKFQEYFGLTMFEFIANGFGMWILSNGTLDYEMKNEISELKHVITLETQRKFLALSCGTPQRYRELVRGENWKLPHKLKDAYALEPFAIMPAVKVERSSHLSSTSYVIPQCKYFLDRASSGIFYLLGDKEMELALSEGKKEKNPFRKAFGLVFREYVGVHLAMPGQLVFIDLDHDFQQPDGKLPDFAIINNNICVLFEVKTTLLNIAARTYFEQKTLEKEVKAGNIQKAVTQLQEFKELVLNGQISDERFSGVSKVISIIVGYEDVFCLNSTLLPMLDKLHGTGLGDFQFASISDIEAIGSAIEQSIDVVSRLEKKLADPGERQWAIATLFHKEMDDNNSILDQAFEEFIIKMGVPAVAGRKAPQ
ncbi:MAG: hypothetical protein EOO07_03335 [Chitinophagaceae bacterium]|nr:MAG: hypothetical protein EOO07_03335 [Chitinophagaceae bacterium]